MTTFPFRALALGTLATLMLAGNAVSQTTSPILDAKALAAKAATPADHRALQEYFLTAAKRYTAYATAHTAIARSYRGTRFAQASDHCERLVANAREAAKEATAAAAMHGQLANLER